MTEITIKLAGKEEIRRLLSEAKGICRPDKYAGKRKKSRLKGALWMEVRSDLEAEVNEEVQVSTHDISEGGIGIWLRKKVEIGDMLYLRDCSDGKRHPWLKVRVTHCINGLKGFLVGGQFECDK